jgi:hypothetical protein
MNLPLLITDLDGTVVNLMDEVIAHLYGVTHIALTPECCKRYEVHESFSPYLCPPGEPSHFSSVDALNKFLVQTCWCNPKMLRRAKPYWDLWRTLLFYMHKGGKVISLTSRDKHCYGLEEATRGWMHQWLPGHLDVCFSQDFVGDDTAQKKRKACVDLMYIHGGSGYIFIDDQPVVADYVAEHAPKGCHVIMPKRPWTENAEVEHVVAYDAAIRVQHIIADAAEAADG